MSLFGDEKTGDLVEISGSDSRGGTWRHQAFRPFALSDEPPGLSGATHLVVAEARAALAALDSTAVRLPNSRLFRMPAVRREAQATSALEGTYAPLAEVYAADDEVPQSAEMREILNYVAMATHAFAWVAEGRPLSVPFLEDLQRLLVQGTPLESSSTGRIRDLQVVIGRRQGVDPALHAVHTARFIPPPPGDDLAADVRDLVAWMGRDHRGRIDPVVVAALSHHQFETLHPFHDGNGRIGRLLVILLLHTLGVLREPTLTISPWFEARRTEYYDRLFDVSAGGDWDGYIRFFADGLRSSAEETHQQMIDLIAVQAELKAVIQESSLRAVTAPALVDVAVAQPIFTIKRAAAELDVSVARANKLVNQLVELDVLALHGSETYNRRFSAPRVLDVLLRRSS